MLLLLFVKCRNTSCNDFWYKSECDRKAQSFEGLFLWLTYITIMKSTAFQFLPKYFSFPPDFWYWTRLWAWQKDQSCALWGGPIAAAWGCDVPVCPACRWGDIQEAHLDGSHTASAEVGLSQCPGHMLCQSLTILLVLEAFSDLELPLWAYHSRSHQLLLPKKAGTFREQDGIKVLIMVIHFLHKTLDLRTKIPVPGTPRKLVRCFCSSHWKRVAARHFGRAQRGHLLVRAESRPLDISGGLRGSGGHPHHLL